MAKSWKTRLIHTDAKVPQGYRSLVPAIRRGSTTVFKSVGVASDHWDQHKVGYTYGLYGTPTTLELAARICELEGGTHTVLAAGGQAAISLIDIALLKAGDHILIPENIYYPNRKLTTNADRAIWGDGDVLSAGDRHRDFGLDSGEHATGLDGESSDRSPWKCRMCRRLWRPRMRRV